MIIGIPKESAAGECRVAATPNSVKKLIKLGYEIQCQSDCGQAAHFPDELYEQSGAKIIKGAEDLYQNADILLKVLPPTEQEVDWLRSGTLLISFVWPAQNDVLVKRLAKERLSVLSMDCVPRISRAQKMDALSSMANIAGYRAIIEASNEFGSFFTGQITAAGKVPPAKVLVIGAGVAGLSAIGTASGLGAIVRAFDTREAVKDQVKSMGGEFLELEFEESGEGSGGYAKVMSEEFIKAEMALFLEQAKEVDIIVTTALIPGKRAPILITEEMVKAMRPGSVVVDLAAENGGNCELTEPHKKVTKHGVTIIGYTDFPSRLPTQSSTLYSNNLVNFLTDVTPEKDGKFVIDLEDAVVRGSIVTHDGEVTWPPPSIEPSPTKTDSEDAEVTPEIDREAALAEVAAANARRKRMWTVGGLCTAAVFLLLVGIFFPVEFVSHFTVFVLACIIGWQVVWNVTPALHTPLMSVTNAISGIIVVGAMFQISSDWFSLTSILALLAVLISTINISGGFLVTQRMLAMFQKD